MDCTSKVHLTGKRFTHNCIAMNKSIFTLIFAVLLSSIVFPAKASASRLTEASILTATSENSAVNIDRKKKRKLKKKVRQAGRVYKLVKSDRKDKKKARKVQRKIRRVISIL